jgi:hypothetical protein
VCPLAGGGSGIELDGAVVGRATHESAVEADAVRGTEQLRLRGLDEGVRVDERAVADDVAVVVEREVVHRRRLDRFAVFELVKPSAMTATTSLPSTATTSGVNFVNSTVRARPAKYFDSTSSRVCTLPRNGTASTTGLSRSTPQSTWSATASSTAGRSPRPNAS